MSDGWEAAAGWLRDGRRGREQRQQREPHCVQERPSQENTSVERRKIAGRADYSLTRW
jgi:hypothetical protein